MWIYFFSIYQQMSSFKKQFKAINVIWSCARAFELTVTLPVRPSADSTASIIARRRRFHRLTQELYELPVVVWDDGEPILSSTSTLTLRVCSCQRGTRLKVCQGEAFLSSAGLSTGALIAILLCVLILLGEFNLETMPEYLSRARHIHIILQIIKEQQN